MKDQKDILNIIKARRSIRKYKNKQVSQDLINRVLEAARWAPSAVNRQSWHFIVVNDPCIKKDLANKPFSGPVQNAPAVTVVCVDESKDRWAVINGSLASQNIMLEAYSLGLGTCFVGAFDESRVKSVLNIPKEIKVLGLIALGYPDEEPKVPPRKDLENISSLNKYSSDKSSILQSGILSFVSKQVKKSI
ncbi:nitroreductase family protein [Candidatus Dojkabacteria bacterium]|nr:nitroreductase family protein [Candidatus Dojkabacteria bacterium]